MSGKERAAREALQYVRDGIVVGLGSGSTSECFVRALAEAAKAGKFKDLHCVASSVPIANMAQELGLKIVSLRDCGVIDVSVDGADEVDPRLNLIKGLGAALVREKIMEQNSRRFICIVDESKLVKRLGTKAPLPVEVVTYCHDCHDSFFHSLGGTPHIRTNADGSPFVSDNGNYIYHLTFSEGIESPSHLESKLLSRAGVVGTGLFLSMTDTVIVGSEAGVRTIKHH